MISIVTVGMNHLLYIKALVHSLYIENCPKVDFEMIYVDNCSKDKTVDFIRANYPRVHIIENKTPLGFGENNNKGVRASKGKYIAIINPDIVLQEGCIDNLYEYAETHTDIGILVPKLLNPDLSVQYSVRGFISLKALLWRIVSKGNDNAANTEVSNYLCKNMDTSKIQFIDWSIGAALFIPRDVYERLKGFDTDYFLYMEDEDLCLRSWKLNLPVVYLPQAVMVHNHLRGSSKLGKKTVLHLKSMMTFFTKHGFFIRSYKNTISI
ncbi:glycosyltransferase family 2 protein [uncultured Bacteroides sp.]|uniref:glycosyltransferase family 2 protein n=1 Tax=uncultured Bacteroides sp. TaxID=162156 RepID=UPI002AAA8D4E|nr:glycosyltransferase family 2 protein [uncultured Bacteroides sp.]